MMVPPYVLVLSRFWVLLSDKNKHTVRSCCYRFCEFLLRVPTWKWNAAISNQYNIPDPYMVVQRRLERFYMSLKENELCDTLQYWRPFVVLLVYIIVFLI